jgi:acyl dehydratase
MERQMATQAKQNGGIYFDDLRVGDRYQTPGRTVTETDVVNFAGLSADYNSLHVDAEFAKGLDFGQRVAHGLLILSMVSGLTSRLPFIVQMGPAIQGLLDLNCQWPKPTFLGDTIHVVVSITDMKVTSKGTSGIVTMSRDAVNQRGETVMKSVGKFLIKRDI